MRKQRRRIMGLLGVVLGLLLLVYYALDSFKLSPKREYSLDFSLPPALSLSENSLHQIGSDQNLAIFSVFLDRRLSDNRTEHRNPDGHANGVLRIILVKKGPYRPRLRCLFNDGTLIPSRDLRGQKYHFYELTENHGRLYGGYSIHCDVPSSVDLSSGVKIISENSEVFVPIIHFNASRIETLPSQVPNGAPFKHKFTVCVPALHHIKSLNRFFLSDWLKIHIHLGVTQFRMYYSEIIPTWIKEIFESFSDQVEVEFHPLYWKENNRAVLFESWYYLQIMTVNDCLLRSLYDSEYAFFGDLDEILIPQSSEISNWSELVDQIWTNRNIPGHCFPGLRFHKSQGGITRNLIRARGVDSILKKCLVRPQAVFEMGIHHISKPYEESAILNPKGFLDSAFIYHYHYIAPRVNGKIVVDDVRDDSILRFLRK